MTLLLTVLAAVICTVIWYLLAPKNELMLGRLCLMYWGASIMWLVDGIFSFAADGAAFFEKSAGQIMDDSYLGISVIVLGLVIWLVTLLIKDPRGVLVAALSKKFKSNTNGHEA